MFTAIRHSSRRFRAVLLAGMAIVLLVSILEAGHSHGVFTPLDDHCALCQHSLSLDKPTPVSATLAAPLLLLAAAYIFYPSFRTFLAYRFTAIRAPPHH